jgi:hypothetical protein
VSRLRALSTAALACLAAVGCNGVEQRSTTASSRQGPVIIRPSLDRTAVWVGDAVTYTIEVRCAPGYDIIENDLAGDRLQLEGLEVRAASSTREMRDDGGAVYRASFQLASYASEHESLRIAPRMIRYYQRQADGQTIDRAPAGTVEIPGEELALRSTLLDSGGAEIRTGRPLALLPRFARAFGPVGLTLVAVSLATAAAGLVTPIVRRRRPARAQGPVRRPTDRRPALDEIRRLDDTGSPDDLHKAFGRLDRLLREHLAETGIDARSLTPDEIDARADGAGETTARAVAQLLRECERVRYGGPRHAPSRELLADALHRAEAALQARAGADR